MPAEVDWLTNKVLVVERGVTNVSADLRQTNERLAGDVTLFGEHLAHFIVSVGRLSSFEQAIMDELRGIKKTLNKLVRPRKPKSSRKPRTTKKAVSKKRAAKRVAS